MLGCARDQGDTMADTVEDLFDEAEDSYAREGGPPGLIASIGLKGLFGRYDYEIHVPTIARSQRLLLFYGDNGTGKTTILRLLWHLLSAAEDRGHRTLILNIPFESIDVHLTDGSEIRAYRSHGGTGPYTIRVSRDGLVLTQTEWPTAGSRGDFFDSWNEQDLIENLDTFPDETAVLAREHLAKRRLFSYLKNLEARPYYLADDRNIYSDDLETPSRVRRDRETALLRHTMGGGVRHVPEEAQGVVAQELETSMARASAFLRNLTLGGNASGSAGANSVYLEVLNRLGGGQSGGSEHQIVERLRSRLADQGDRSKRFEILGLVPRFPTDDFLSAVSQLPEGRAPIAEEVLTPYLDSLTARLEALQPAQRLLRTFLDEVNGFLRDKELIFRPQRGLQIRVSADTYLETSQLSSGERQIVLLLCNALLARRGTRLFIVDEPELSLNAKWQRKVLSGLLACTDGAPVQFIVATHSLELLSEYQSNVARLVNERIV